MLSMLKTKTQRCSLNDDMFMIISNKTIKTFKLIIKFRQNKCLVKISWSKNDFCKCKMIFCRKILSMKIPLLAGKAFGQMTFLSNEILLKCPSAQFFSVKYVTFFVENSTVKWCSANWVFAQMTFSKMKQNYSKFRIFGFPLRPNGPRRIHKHSKVVKQKLFLISDHIF
jgi:hypothetical protein